MPRYIIESQNYKNHGLKKIMVGGHVFELHPPKFVEKELDHKGLLREIKTGLVSKEEAKSESKDKVKVEAEQSAAEVEPAETEVESIEAEIGTVKVETEHSLEENNI